MEKILFDVHCHLSFPQFDGDRDEVIKRASQQGIQMINASVSVEEIPKARELASKHENVYWTLGLSASETNTEKVEETIQAIRENRKHVIGIGEVGLDYYWIKDETLREIERKNFERFIQLAVELNLPLVVHSRDAEEDCINMLEKHGKKALLHCFSGSIQQAEKAIKFGCLISIPTNVTHNKQKQNLAESLPLKALVLETDAPYLSPTPKTRNEPVNIKKSIEKIAELKKVGEKEVEEATTINAKRFFDLR
jgi:TatD DNase family protein